MKTLIRRGILWRLIWVCTVCLCPTKRTLDLYMYGLRLRINKCDMAVRQMPRLRVHPDLFFFESTIDSDQLASDYVT